MIRIITIAALLALAPTHAHAELVVGGFSAMPPDGTFADGWKPLVFKKIENRTTYRLARDDDATVVEAVARASASGLVREIEIDPVKYPILAWRWKIANVLHKSDVRSKSGDDYAARLYITFAYDRERVGITERARFEAAKFFYGQYPPIGAINYIWDSKTTAGTIVPNAYTSRARMVVVESGDARAGQWVTVERNVLEDYRRAFGGSPPKISGVAIMTDTDNTGESARAWYGDVVFRER
jgi:hypothetical protein